jgi:hypothetical protein
VFWHLQSNSKISGVPEDSQVPISRVWVSSSHPLKVRLWHWRLLFLFLKKLKAFVLALRKVEGFYFCSWRLKVLVFVFREVEGFCFRFWMLKVFVVSFECWRFLVIFLDVEGSWSYFWMLKVFISGFKCWKFFLLLLDIEGFYFCYFYIIWAKFSLCFNLSTSNSVYKVRFFQKYIKL